MGVVGAVGSYLFPSKSNNQSSALAVQQSEMKKNFDALSDPYNFMKAAAASGDSWALDKFLDYELSEKSQQTARDWTAQREDSSYQRLVADLKKAGINPYFALTGGSPISSSSQGVNYQGSQATSASNARLRADTQKQIALISAFVTAFSAVLGTAGKVVGTLGK